VGGNWTWWLSFYFIRLGLLGYLTVYFGRGRFGAADIRSFCWPPMLLSLPLWLILGSQILKVGLLGQQILQRQEQNIARFRRTLHLLELVPCLPNPAQALVRLHDLYAITRISFLDSETIGMGGETGVDSVPSA
jgi:hypothetical protein